MEQKQKMIQAQPFKSPTDDCCFWCNICKTYNSNFSNSSKRTEIKRCRKCARQLARQKKENMDDIDRLKYRLYQNLMYQKQSKLALSVTRETIVLILSKHSVANPGLVKTISPKKNNDGSWGCELIFFASKLEESLII